ncbi:hypothetical protein [Chitinophaga flava]|uniref:SMI1/KNR4 family protein n=1 Tax=Chitinophaga flava TaxID=2259036 RepID=A0A365XUI1_9BACT|nr:hypothetical protein [Chitinophaga flava]RBL89993.1 hypothetical protein DF182_26325 [Chitinophaga flava]
MRSGFELFKTRKQEESIDIATLEQQYGIQLPPLYKLFVSTFHLDRKVLAGERYFDTTIQNYREAAMVAYYPLLNDPEKVLDISLMYDLEFNLIMWQNNYQREPEWMDYGFFKITDIGMGGGLYVGTRDENKDKIFRIVWDWDEPYDEICDNIFELVRGLTLVYDPNDPPHGITSYDQLYKNWGDEYWQIRS